MGKDPNDHIPDHDIDEPESDFDQDAWEDNEQAKEDAAMED